jgi:glycosyltransferase involved in cell wall biosynthesis
MSDGGREKIAMNNCESERTQRSDADFPNISVVTMRSGARPQNATFRLMNVLSELTAVSLITVELSDDSKIHDQYDVTEISQGAKAETLLDTALFFIYNQIRLCREILQRDAPVIYFFGGTAYTLPIVFTKVIGKTAVVQPRGDVPLTLQLEWEEEYPDVVARSLTKVIQAMEFCSLWFADRIVTYTESMAMELGLTRFQDKLYPHGTRYISLCEEFKPRTPFRERDQRMGMIGRLDVEKGIEELTEAITHLSDDICFRFVGDGSKREWIERQLHEEINDGRVELTGWVDHDEIPRHLNDFRLLVLASEPTEGLPTVIQEAFACGTPVYTTPVSGIPDVVIEGKTGFLMDDRRPEQIASDIESILNRDDLAELSDNCREFAVDNYSFQASVENFQRLLSSLK